MTPAPQFCLSRLCWSRCDQDLQSPHTWRGSMGTGAPGKATRGPCLPAQQPGDTAPAPPQPRGLADTDAVEALEIALATEPDAPGRESWPRALAEGAAGK